MASICEYQSFASMDKCNKSIMVECETPLLPIILPKKTEASRRKCAGKMWGKVPVLDKMLHNAILDYKVHGKVTKVPPRAAKRKSLPSSELPTRLHSFSIKPSEKDESGYRSSALFLRPSKELANKVKDIRRSCVVRDSENFNKQDKNTVEILKRIIWLRDRSSKIQPAMDRLLIPSLKEKVLVPFSNPAKPSTRMTLCKKYTTKERVDENCMKIVSMKIRPTPPSEDRELAVNINIENTGHKRNEPLSLLESNDTFKTLLCQKYV